MQECATPQPRFVHPFLRPTLQAMQRISAPPAPYGRRVERCNLFGIDLLNLSCVAGVAGWKSALLLRRRSTPWQRFVQPVARPALQVRQRISAPSAPHGRWAEDCNLFGANFSNLACVAGLAGLRSALHLRDRSSPRPRFVHPLARPTLQVIRRISASSAPHGRWAEGCNLFGANFLNLACVVDGMCK